MDALRRDELPVDVRQFAAGVAEEQPPRERVVEGAEVEEDEQHDRRR